MHTDRSNFRAPALEGDDAIMSISLIKENKKTYRKDPSIRLISNTNPRSHDKAPPKLFKTRTFEAKKFSMRKQPEFNPHHNPESG